MAFAAIVATMASSDSAASARKRDIRGVTLGMTPAQVQQVITRLSGKCDRIARDDHCYVPSTVKEYEGLTENFAIKYTTNLPEHRVWRIFYNFPTEAPLERLKDEVSEQFGLDGIEPLVTDKSAAWAVHAGAVMIGVGRAGKRTGVLLIEDVSMRTADEAAIPMPKF